MTTDGPRGSVISRVRERMRETGRSGIPVPNPQSPNGPTFALGFAPPPTAPELTEQIDAAMIDADILMTDLVDQIEGIVKRERSTVETALIGMLEPVRREITETVVDSANLVADFSRKIEDAIFDEVGAIAEDMGTTFGPTIFPPKPDVSKPPERPPKVHPPVEPPATPPPTEPPLDGDCDPLAGTPETGAHGFFEIPAQNGSVNLGILIGPYKVSISGRMPVIAPWLGVAMPSLEQQEAVSTAYLGTDDTSGGEDSSVYWSMAPSLHAGGPGLAGLAIMPDRSTVPVWLILAGFSFGLPRLVDTQCLNDESQPPTVPPPVAPPPADCPPCPEKEPPEEPEDEEPEEPEDEPEDVQCIIWMDRKTCEIYALPVDDPPRTSGDIRIGASRSGASLCRLIERTCKDAERPQSPGGDLETGSTQACLDLPSAATVVLTKIPGLTGMLARMMREFSEVSTVAGIANPIGTFVAGILDRIRSFVESGLEDGDKLTNAVYAAAGCADPTHLTIRAAASIIGFLRQWLGDGFADAMVPLLQQARFICPTSVPSAVEATQAFLGDTINESTWRCWVRANNFIDADFLKVTQAARSKLGISELVQLRARGLLSPRFFTSRIRELGFLSETEPEEFWRISEQIPGLGDLVRFMVRDAADDDVAKEFGYDEFFDDKFTGRVKDWAKQSRVPDDYMKMIWRSHWQIPSPTTLAEMRRRLSHLSKSDAAFVDDAKVRQALLVQDIAPGWIDQYMAIQFRELTRVDARRLLERGVINKKEAIFQWGQLGYKTVDAERLVELAERIATARAAKHPAVRRYARGDVNQQQMEVMLEQDGIGERFFPVALRRAKLESRVAKKHKCIGALRKRFLSGEIVRERLSVLLLRLGFDTEQAEEKVDTFVCELEARGKKASGSQLCNWFEEGLIDTSEFFNRLRNLGWDRDDATRFVRFCTIKLVRKQTAAERKRLEAVVKRTAKDRAAAKRQENELERARKDADSETKRATNVAKSRRKILNDIADVMHKRLQIKLADAKRLSNAVFQKLTEMGFATRDETLQLMLEAANSPETLDFDQLETTALELINERIFPSPFS